MNSLISVIIPIYNVENYLAKCLDSVIQQTYTNLEIICVNDCSPDNCSKILEKYKNKDTRIKVITHSQNQGLSGARNTGINNATGEFLYFLDSDDYIATNYLQEAIEQFTPKTDFVANKNIECFMMTEKGEEPIIYKKPPLIKRFFEFILNKNTINLSKYYNIDKKPNVTVWNKLYRSSFIRKNDISFPEGLKSEDNYWNDLICINCKKATIYSGVPYYYQIKRKDSIMGGGCFYKSEINSVKKIYEYLKEHNLFEKAKINVGFYLANNFFRNENKSEFYALTKETLKSFLGCGGGGGICPSAIRIMKKRYLMPF